MMTNIKKVITVINEQHTLLPDQEKALEKTFPNTEIEKCLIPASGITVKRQRELALELSHELSDTVIVFVSPVPVLLAWTVRLCSNSLFPVVAVFANDHREKKELPNGKVISVVAREGWKIEVI